MAKGKSKENRCGTDNEACCSVESVITVDERGQMVLPKELREKADIRPGDKLAVVSFYQNNKVCCITLIKANDFSGMVKVMLSPMIDEISQQESEG